MRKKTLIILSLLLFTCILLLICKRFSGTLIQTDNDYNYTWPPADSLLIPPTRNMKTWPGKEIPNTSLVGKWRFDTDMSLVEESKIEMYLTVDKEGNFTISIPDNIDNERKNELRKYFSKEYAKGGKYEGTVRCYDIWCAEGSGPDGCYVVGFYDKDGILMHHYAFVYCQINNNEFTLGNVV